MEPTGSGSSDQWIKNTGYGHHGEERRRVVHMHNGCYSVLRIHSKRDEMGVEIPSALGVRCHNPTKLVADSLGILAIH